LLYPSQVIDPALDEVLSHRDTIIHVIAGQDSLEQTIRLLRDGFKVLVLGYKNYGRGEGWFKLHPQLPTDLNRWRTRLTSLLHAGHVCFDNLAVEQLDVLMQIGEELAAKHYLGADGTSSCYADAVTDTYAISSTSARVPSAGRTIREYFTQTLDNVCVV
jgi:hypothetical protein